MFKKLMVLFLVLGMLFGLSAGVASAGQASDEEPPRPGEDPPPRDTCELNDWEKKVVDKLAQRYDVDVSEIAEWYCQGYEFGEIALAYEISMRTDYTVEEIFAMRDDGLGWDEILKEVGLFHILPVRGNRIPFPVPPRVFKGIFPVRHICIDDEENPIIQDLADMYGLSYEQVYRWICGPFDFSIFDWDDGDWMGDMDGYEYNEGQRMHITATEWVLPNIDIDDLPPVDVIKEILEAGRSAKHPPGFPKGRP